MDNKIEYKKIKVKLKKFIHCIQSILKIKKKMEIDDMKQLINQELTQKKEKYLRVRSILSKLNTKTKKILINMIPDLTIPQNCLINVKYPYSILKALKNKDQNEYCLLGILSENLLRYPIDKITIDTLIKEFIIVSGNSDKTILKKISSSKTTNYYIEKLHETRIKFDSILKGNILYDEVLEYNSVQGHPDGKTETQLFEVKMTANLEKEWINFLLQAYSYSAIKLCSTELFLILPLQGEVVNLNLEKWSIKNRMKWRELLDSQAKKILENNVNNDISYGMIIQKRFNIGMHVKKKPSLKDTFLEFNDIYPYQIFLGNPTSSKLLIQEKELSQAYNIIGKKKIYVHTPYIINLSKDGNRDEILVRNIEYSVKAGCKGVVVHVGKSTTKPIHEAIENMRKTIIDAIKFATIDCPLLLETPAGQGTETLTKIDDFLDFVMSFDDSRIAICVDTCHVFTNGHDPLVYLKKAYNTGLLRLVHFNDSASICGACVDRHAYIGTGHIGVEKMAKLAAFCSVINVDMVIE